MESARPDRIQTEAIQTEATRANSRPHATEQASFRDDQRSHYLVAEARPQRRAQVADAIGKTELDRLGSGPIFAGEQGFFRAFEPHPAALLHEVDEALVNFLLQRLEPLHVLGIFRQERS